MRLHVALEDLDFRHRLGARHILDQLGERHPEGRRGQDVRRLAQEVAVHDVLEAELVERVAPLLGVHLTEVGVPATRKGQR